MSDKLLEVKNLSVEYDTEISTVYAVNGLDLDLNYGETLGLVGESGCSPERHPASAGRHRFCDRWLHQAGWCGYAECS